DRDRRDEQRGRARLLEPDAESRDGLPRTTARLGGVRRHALDVLVDACARYQAIVRSRPARNGVLARKPKSSSARETSSWRRGWPFGFVVSQTTVPSYPVSSAVSSASSRIEISSPVPRFTGSAPSYRSAARTSPWTQSSTKRNSRVGVPSPQSTTRSRLSSIFLIRSGITCDVSRSKLSRG